MKKKQLVKSGDAGDYTVGQVSGSLFPEQHKPGALSALFSSSSSANTLVFVPAPQPTAAPPAPAQTPEPIRGQKKSLKSLSAAEQKLQDRERALQNADDDGPTAARKLKHKRPENEEEEDPRAGKRKRKNTVEERLKLKRTVFVGNLPASCSKKSLLSLFRPAGVVESVRFRSVVREDPTISRKVAAIQRKVHPKKQNINAYVVFREEEAAAGALRWNGQEIQTGFHIRVDRVSKRSGHDHKRSIFVGNLPYDASELPLREHFEECGTVEAVRLVRDRDSGMGKGFGYVLFESPDSVMLALKLNGSTFLERRIRVKRSVKKEKEKKGRPSDGKTAPDRQRRTGGGAKGPKHEFRKNNVRNPGTKPTQASSFTGETADPSARRSKAQKKKLKHRKSKPAVHI